ncbi:MAG: alanine racemase [Myxococcales bacterium]|nr:alanine racemase [Myxococcales bacterium]
MRPTRAEVNLANLRHNLRVVQRHAGSAQVWAVLKADGYGHGAKAIARTLERAGAKGICVALLEEGVELREAGIKLPILVMGGYYGRAHGELLRHDLIPVVSDLDQVEALAEEVRFTGSEAARVHLKVDTGMARLGALPKDVRKLAEVLRSRAELKLHGLMTHFACADSGDPATVAEQLGVFQAASDELAALGLVPEVRHAANSAALLSHAPSCLDIVRPGIALFGVAPGQVECTELRPVMSVKSELISVREISAGQGVGYGWTWKASRPSRIATVPMGYADGLSRGLSNRGHVLVRGRRAPVVGVVSMDMTMIDVTDVEGADLGDEAVLLGRQKGVLGEECISAGEIAQHLGTIPWEVLTAVSRRVPRFYREP